MMQEQLVNGVDRPTLDSSAKRLGRGRVAERTLAASSPHREGVPDPIAQTAAATKPISAAEYRLPNRCRRAPVPIPATRGARMTSVIATSANQTRPGVAVPHKSGQTNWSEHGRMRPHP